MFPALDVEIRSAGDAADAGSSAFTPEDQVALLLTDVDPVGVHEIDARRWRIFCRDRPARAAAEAVLATHPAVVAVRPVDVPDADWVARSQAHLRACTAGRVTVAPPWDVPASPAGLLVVIEPSMGFGTGHHPSTRLALLALQDRPLAGHRVIDAGTGSGLLAIAAALLGAAGVCGFDRDPAAIASARRNLALNPAAHVAFEVAELMDIPGPAALGEQGPADLVVANLTADVLVRCARNLTDLAKPGGRLIVSGLTAEQERDVAAAFHGTTPSLRPVRRWIEGDWVALALEGLGRSQV